MGSKWQFLTDDVILIGLISVITLYFLIQHSFLILWRNICKTSSKRIYLTKIITNVNGIVMSPPQSHIDKIGIKTASSTKRSSR